VCVLIAYAVYKAINFLSSYKLTSQGYYHFHMKHQDGRYHLKTLMTCNIHEIEVVIMFLFP